MSRARTVLRRIGFGTIISIGILGAVLWFTPVGTRIRTKSDCPILAWITPTDHSEILDTDYIELNASAIGPRVFEPVHVRIYGSGLVERETEMTVKTPHGGDTFGCPLNDSDKTLHISLTAAQALLAKARDLGFCRLCASYQHAGVMDGSIEEVRLNLHGKLKSVWNHNGEPPSVFSELAEQIWTLSRVESVADIRKFSPEREAACRRIEDERFDSSQR